MALPPNRFKLLLEGSKEEICDRLSAEGCLSEEGIRNRKRIFALIDETVIEYTAWMQAHPGWTGESLIDRMEKSLLNSPYVNTRARKLAEQCTSGSL